LVQREIGIKPKMRWTAPGELNIYADRKLIFSYKRQGHMPSDQEVLELLGAAAKA
jgi:hypothetical protein